VSGIPHSTFCRRNFCYPQVGMSDVPRGLDMAALYVIICHDVNAKSRMILDL